nr:hypothetical protein [Neorhizobium tomejilense]
MFDMNHPVSRKLGMPDGIRLRQDPAPIEFFLKQPCVAVGRSIRRAELDKEPAFLFPELITNPEILQYLRLGFPAPRNRVCHERQVFGLHPIRYLGAVQPNGVENFPLK